MDKNTVQIVLMVSLMSRPFIGQSTAYCKDESIRFNNMAKIQKIAWVNA